MPLQNWNDVWNDIWEDVWLTDADPPPPVTESYDAAAFDTGSFDVGSFLFGGPGSGENPPVITPGGPISGQRWFFRSRRRR